MKRHVSNSVQIIVLAALLAASGALWLGRDHVGSVFAALMDKARDDKKTSRRGGDRKIPVVVARTRLTANNFTVEAVGTGRARRSVMLFPKVPGEIVEFPAKAGQRISQGDVIMRLDTMDAELAVRVAKTKFIEAKRLMERSEQLLDRNVNSQAKVDDARNLSKRAELELNQAEQTLKDLTSRAPFDGVVGIPKVEMGDRVSTNTAIITLDDRHELLVEFEVPELYIPRLSPGHKIVARTSSFGERKFTGKIAQLDSRVDPTSRSVKVRAVLPNAEDLLRPGMSFSVEVILSGDSYPTIPELALLWGKGASYVWRIKDGRAEKSPVRIVKRLNATILVAGRISEGDLVVIEGVQRLRPGRAVTFLSPPKEHGNVNSKLEAAKW